MTRDPERRNAAGYPVFLNVAGKTCVVVGGGEVAERKVGVLLEAGARVVVVSPALTPGLSALRDEGRLEHVARAYREGDLAGAFLALAATGDRATNQAVAAEAARRRVLANVADAPQGGDFSVPALLRQGDLAVAVGTGGRSPAMARFVRDELARVLTAEYVTLLAVVAEVRSALAAQGIAVPTAAWRAALDGELLALSRAGETDRLRDLLVGRLTNVDG